MNCPRCLPQRLRWNINAENEQAIEVSVANARALISDLDLYVLCHCAFGKGAIKQCRMSPDAFIQMSLQLAYFRDIGCFNLTYEASMTRLYREGRTETVRPVSSESCAFVRAIERGAPRDEVLSLLRVAGNKHQESYRNSMAGKGVDRHLFALYIISKYLKVESPFLTEAIHEPWRLSTSQTPYNQEVKKVRHIQF